MEQVRAPLHQDQKVPCPHLALTIDTILALFVGDRRTAFDHTLDLFRHHAREVNGVVHLAQTVDGVEPIALFGLGRGFNHRPQINTSRQVSVKGDVVFEIRVRTQFEALVHNSQNRVR